VLGDLAEREDPDLVVVQVGRGDEQASPAVEFRCHALECLRGDGARDQVLHRIGPVQCRPAEQTAQIVFAIDVIAADTGIEPGDNPVVRRCREKGVSREQRPGAHAR